MHVVILKVFLYKNCCGLLENRNGHSPLFQLPASILASYEDLGSKTFIWFSPTSHTSTHRIDVASNQVIFLWP